MERILVSMEARNGAWGALSRAFSLAERTGLNVSVLLVYESSMEAHCPSLEECPFRERLELMFENAKLKGIPVDFYMTQGSYEEEVIRFVTEQGITHLIVESFEEVTRDEMKYLKSIESIRHRVKCRVEVVHQKK